MSKISDMMDKLKPAADEDGHLITQTAYDNIVAQLAAEKHRLDWLEEQARQSMTGISFDYVPRCEGDPAGWRFMRRHFISNPAKSLREAVDNAMEARRK